MKLVEVKKKAEEIGVITTKHHKKAEIIRAIQEAEGNPPSFGTNTGDCQYDNCCWWNDCIKENKKNNGNNSMNVK